MNKEYLVEDRLADFSTDRRVVILSAIAICIGAFGALIAYALMWLITAISNFAFFQTYAPTMLSPSGHHLGLWVILMPVVGGLVIGLMARYGSEKIRGHGIPEALEAILVGRSRIEAKVAVLKPVSSAISIGTGGPFGAEGPIIMTGGAFGSLFAQFFHLSSAERKTLLVAGAAAGMSAIFATPIAAVLLAVELLLFEWKPRSFIPVALASAAAASLRIPLMGAGPIFPMDPHPALPYNVLLLAGLVGIIAGLLSGLLTSLVYAFEDIFQRLPIHWMWWPAIGGLFVGIGGWIDPRVLGVGYDLIHSILRGEIIGASLLGLLIGKSLVWSLSLGSGTSGGVLAPLLIMGGALGAFEAHWIPVGDAGLWALLSMAATMGGTMRSPFTAIVFTLELTHDLNALPALLIACIASEIVTVLLLRRSILTEKVARHGHHIVREYSVDPLELRRVNEVMDLEVPTVPLGMKVSALAKEISKPQSPLGRHQALPIVDTNGMLAGIITKGDVLRSLGESKIESMSVEEVGTKNLIVTYPDDTVSSAVIKMLKNDIGRLLVVDPENPRKLLGYLGRPNIIEARLQRLEEEHSREQGWMKNLPILGQD
ncbi:MAG TPA: chloride channel protein [Bacteroidota bacterium]|nr:chloride channel protein [Bacteroidota bacterium]